MKKIFFVFIIVVLILSSWYFYNQNANIRRIPLITIDKSDGYKLLIDGKPFLIKGVCYSPIPIGKDYEYNFWGDPAQPWLTDGKLMKAAGVNTVRFYRLGKNPAEVRKVVDDLYAKFGIRSLMGSYLGLWNWPPPNYTDKAFTDKTKSEILEMVRFYKDSPGVLMWVLGNENNYSFDQNIQRWTSDAIDALPTPEAQRLEKARIYYSFVNDVAREVKKIDSRHPVVLSVGEVMSLDVAKAQCPDVDVIGMLAYRGPGFGNLFRQVKQKFDLPIVMIEWGCDSFNADTREPDEADQADYIKLQWNDIKRNSAFSPKGEKNCLGGTVFEWTDEWWKANPNISHTWSVHDEAGTWQNTSYTFDAYGADKMNMNEEWWGIVSLDAKKSEKGLNARAPKQSYNVLRSLWAKQ